MANPKFPYDVVGANTLNPRIPTPSRPAPFALGTVAIGDDNSQWIYVRAVGPVSGTCTLDTADFTITDAAGNHTAPVTFVGQAHGWVYLTAGFHS